MEKVTENIKEILRKKRTEIDARLCKLEDRIARDGKYIEQLQESLDAMIEEYNELNSVARDISELIGYETEEA